MTEKDSRSAEKHLAEKLWLSFYNNLAYEKGLITEQERNRMILKIEQRGGGL